MQQALKLRQRYFQAQEEWADLVRQWSKIPLKSLDINQLQTEVNCFVHTVDYLEMGKFYYHTLLVSMYVLVLLFLN